MKKKVEKSINDDIMMNPSIKGYANIQALCNQPYQALPASKLLLFTMCILLFLLE